MGITLPPAENRLYSKRTEFASSDSKFFPFRVNPFLKEELTGSHKIFTHVKMAKNVPNVFSPLNIKITMSLFRYSSFSVVKFFSKVRVVYLVLLFCVVGYWSYHPDDGLKQFYFGNVVKS